MALWGLFFLSGASALGYQVLWSKMFALGLGHEFPALLAVISAFFAGMALGGILSARILARWGNSAFTALEIVIGVAGLASPTLIDLANRSALQYEARSMGFLAALVVLLPGVTAMGASLPAMAALAGRQPLAISGAYAANTLGAVVGCLGTAFLLMPKLGLRAPLYVLPLVNFFIAVIAWNFFGERGAGAPNDFDVAVEKLPAKSGAEGPPSKTSRTSHGALAVAPASWSAALQRRFRARSQRHEVQTHSNASKNPIPLPRLALTFFTTGFLALGFETLGVRMLSQSLENTLYSFALILAVYLFGQALGAFLRRRFVFSAFAFMPLAMAAALWLFKYSGAFYEILRAQLGDSVPAVTLAEFLVTAAIFILPTIGMGAVFAEISEAAGEYSLGVGLAWNSIGAAAGAVVVPTLIFPWLGAFGALVLLAIGYVAIIPKWNARAIASVVGACALFLLGPHMLSLTRIPEGSRLLEQREGAMATVSVIETPDRQRTLFVNNRFQMGGTSARIPELRHGHIPLLLHPDPKRALFIGLGTGISMSAALAHPDLQVDGVELLPEVVAVMPNFFPNTDPAQSPLPAPQARIHVADARRFIRQTTNTYDVIVADLFHPAQDGVGFLYTCEHFARIRERLSTNGLFCQWLPLHQLDLDSLRDITGAFLKSFPNAEAWLLRFNVDAPVIGLIGWSGSAPTFNPILVEQRLALPNAERLAAQLRQVALADSLRLFGCRLAYSNTLREFAEKARPNTDSFPVVMFEGPAFSYQRAAPAYGRLLALLNLWQSPADPAEPSASPLEKFVAARDVYLRALIHESQKETNRALDGYIESARLSEDFTSGYAQGLAIATAQTRANPDLARRILQRLIEAQPNRPVAREMLDRMNAAPAR
jgi:spermidine synthase